MPILYCGIVYTQNKYYTFRTINCILFEFIENEWIVLKQCNTIQHIQKAKAKQSKAKDEWNGVMENRTKNAKLRERNMNARKHSFEERERDTST